MMQAVLSLTAVWLLHSGTAMQLLAATADGAPTNGGALADRIPLLLPYFRHTLASVRLSCVQCLDALLQSHTAGEPYHCKLAKSVATTCPVKKFQS